MNKRQFNDGIYEQLARISKALAHPKRMELIDMLSQAERNVEALSILTDMSIANTSQHLQTLKAANLINIRKDGVYAYYGLADNEVNQVFDVISHIARKRLAEIDRLAEEFLKDRKQFKSVSAEELYYMIRRNSAIVIDTRPTIEYDQAHINGAVSVPVNELEKYLRKIPKNKQVVAYCRGPYCVMSDNALKLLNEKGYKGMLFEGGLPEWRSKGFPIEKIP